MRPRRATTLIALALSLGLLAAACGGADDPTIDGPSDGGGTIDIAGRTANDHGTQDATGANELTFELDDNYFEPTVLLGEAGQTLTLELENAGQRAHTFTIDALGVDVELARGASEQVEVTFPDSGATVFHCHFHEGVGMVGALSVGGSLEPAAGSADEHGEEHETEGESGGENDEGKY